MAQLNKSSTDDLSVPNINPKPALSGWPMVIFWILMIIFACHASTHMVGAGDTWVALACGRHFVHHGVNTVEPFSANSHHAGPTDEDLKTWPKWITDNFSPKTIRYWHPTGWINQNWLTHVMFYWMVETFGSPGNPNYDALVVWKFLMYIIAIAVVFYTGKYMGVNPALSAIFACLALFVGRSFLDIRPAGFSNLFVGVFMLILVLTTYRNVLYIWLIVPLIVLWCNLHGGYIYVFIMLAPFIGAHLLLSVPRKWFIPVYAACSVLAVTAYAAKLYLAEAQDENTFYMIFLGLLCLAGLGFAFYYLIRPRSVTIGFKGVLHAIAASFIAFVGMIIFNPFHLTNLTHTYVISISKYAEKWREINEWHSAWEWSNPVGTSIPFLVMFIIAITAFVFWFFNWIFKPVIKTTTRQKAETAAGDFEWPKMDLALFAIGAMSVYMAVQSRRFIPIAAIAACPVIAFLIDQGIRMMASRIANPARIRLTVPEMPIWLQRTVTIMAVAAMVWFGGFWGCKFYRIYLAPMPDSEQYTSVFMRMTASYAKPFAVGAFMRDNHLKGNMYNYWTEGGFIAWMEDPDPNTGKTPLQLFMDGRAQAAYGRQTYDLWMAIMSGYPPSLGPIMSTRQPTPQEVSNALDEEMRKHNVWCVLMPQEQFDTPLVDGLERHPDWKVVFLTNKEKMLVNIKTKPGEELFMGMLAGTTKYPDEFSQSLSAAHTMLMLKDESARRKGFELAAKAFELRPSQMPLVELFNAARYPEFKSQLEVLLKDHLSKIEPNERQYFQHPVDESSQIATTIERWMQDIRWGKRWIWPCSADGYNNQLVAAIIAANYLEKTSKDPRLIEQYRNDVQQLRTIQAKLMDLSRW